MPAVAIKHGKNEYKVELNAGGSVAEFKAAVFSASGVPPERQKLMAKAWKGVLKDDASFASMPDVAKEGLVVTLMGSAEGVAKPVEKTVFVEDMPASMSALAGHTLPAGLANLGNTCYANSTLEALRAVPELKSALLSYRTSGGAGRALGGGAGAGSSGGPSPYAPITSGLADLLGQLEAAHDAVAPQAFLTRVRAAFPQFAEQGQMGQYKQQDAEEFHGALMTALSGELTSASSALPALTSPRGGSSGGNKPNVIDTLFGVAIEETLTCKESDSEPPVVHVDTGRKLQCNIEGGAGKSVQVNHLHEGVMHGLGGEVEKHSELLGRNAVWTRTARLASLPRYLCIQMMRFYWKATPDSRDHAGVKCKMLRPVAFPADNLDVYDWCSESVKSVLKVSRDRYGDEQVLGHAKKQKLEDGSPSNANNSSSSSSSNAMAVEEQDPDLAAALALSMGQGSSSSSSSSSSVSNSSVLGPGVPKDFRGTYELFAIVTHKGRSADSGHYMAWVRREGSKWLVYDDDTVSETDTEYVTTTLKGGGDDHMAYMLFYRAKA